MPEDTEQLIADLQALGEENMRLRHALNRIATETHTRLYLQDIAREALKRRCPDAGGIVKEEPNRESKGRKVTHRLGCEFSGKDGVKRRLEMYHLEDGAVGFLFVTWWDGEDKPALETPISMTMESFNVLQAMIADYSAHREHYAIN